MLILRGDRDYQVTEADFSGWKNALSGKPEVSFKVYPGLFHLFMPSSSAGPGLGTPADYQKAESRSSASHRRHLNLDTWNPRTHKRRAGQNPRRMKAAVKPASPP